MKRLLISLTCALIAMLSYADIVTNLVIFYQGGGEAILPLETKPVITFVGENMVVRSKLTTIYMPFVDILDYRFVDSSDICEEITPPLFSNGHVIFNGQYQSSIVYVYSLGGKVIKRQKADDQGVVDINMGSLPSGTYIIHTHTNNIKIYKK